MVSARSLVVEDLAPWAEGRSEHAATAVVQDVRSLPSLELLS